MSAKSAILIVVLLFASISLNFAQSKVDEKAEKAKRAQLTKAYETNKSVYNAKKTEPNKKKLVTATFNLAEWYMYTPILVPKDKYPSALKYYREVLKLDPKHKQAKDSKDTIEQIYKSMGRPIPK